MAQVSVTTGPIQAEERPALFPSGKMIEMGRQIAETQCARCHGPDGMQTGKGQPFLAGQRSVYLYRVLQAYQRSERESKSMQHASVSLNQDAMLALSAWYASLTPTRESAPAGAEAEPAPLESDPFSGIGEALRKCTKCHGETGNSSASGMPNLTAQSPEYFVSAMQAYANDDRKHKMMKRLVGDLDDRTIRQMGIFYAVQEPSGSEATGDGDPEAGRKAAEECNICHGADGNADAADTPSLAGQDARYFVKAMQAYQKGQRKHDRMAEAVAGFDDRQVRDMAAWYATQQPVQRDTRIPFTAAEWVERCERCHGLNGNSIDPRFPMLAGQNEAYLRKAMQAYASGARPTSVMHAMSEPLSESDIEQIVRYYAAQKPKSVVYVQLPCEDETGE